MKPYATMVRNLKTAKGMEYLTNLYGQMDGMLVSQMARYTKMIKRHEELYNTDGQVLLVSAPGRTEIGGNHTDHNNGKVLAAAINLDTLAAVSGRTDNTVHISSDGYKPITLSLDELEMAPGEKGTTTSLVRGVAARMQQLGYKIGGFDAAITSAVMSGSGLSSSAAFEVLICAILDALYNGSSIDYKLKAQISQYAENYYFGKPSGLLDQMASASGGLVYIDFKHTENPIVKPMSYNFYDKGFDMVVVSTGGNHANLTDDYSALPTEMKAVAACFGETVLRQVRPEQFYQELDTLRGKVSDRAIMRAMHFYKENERVVNEVEALEKDDMGAFLWQIITSGYSSFMYLQNVYARSDMQELSLALALAEHYLAGKGAWRVHGGGFAGTTLNFVPKADTADFIKKMERVFGRHSCEILRIRPVGASVLGLIDNVE